MQEAERKLKTLHIDTERGFRGGERQCLFLLEGLIRRGHETLLVTPPGSPLEDRAAARAIPTAALRMRGEIDVLAMFKIGRLIDRFRPEIVHLHTSHAHLLGTVAAFFSKTKPPCVVSRRISYSLSRRAFPALARLKYRFGVTRYVAVSAETRRMMIDDGIDGEIIDVVYSGVEPRLFEGVERAAARRKLGIAADLPLFGTVGALVGHKGHRFLLDAFATVAAEIPAALLLIAGDGPLAAQLKRQSEELGLADRVRFLGYRDDVPEVMAALDCYVQPSTEEGICGVVNEALIARLPVVATNVNGIPENIDDGVHGLLVPAGDPAALAGKMLWMARHPSEGQAMALRGRERVLVEKTADAMVDKTLAVYRKIFVPRPFLSQSV